LAQDLLARRGQHRAPQTDGSVRTMSLSALPPAVDRQPVHRRQIDVQGYKRADGLWEVEGHLTDVRPKLFRYVVGETPAHTPIHSMWLRLTIDGSARIVAATAATEAAPFGGQCGAIAPDYASGLVGMTVSGGFQSQVRRLFAGRAGCTHITDLLAAMGTVAVQTLIEEYFATVTEHHKPLQLDTCHALKTEGPIVKMHYPQWYRPSGPSAPSGSSGSPGPAD
jgi:hypothetical protein